MSAVPDTVPRLRRLTKRAQFLRAARGVRASRRSFMLQAIRSDNDMPGIGYTVTKKTGNSPERSRIKRRLRAAVQACAAEFHPQYDYVLIGRREALGEPFSGLVSHLSALLSRVHANQQDAARQNSNRHDAKQT